MMMISQILTHTPLWVWGLLSALLALGWWQTGERRVHRAQLLALPLALLGLGLWSMLPGFRAQPLAGLAWALALIGALQWSRSRASRSGASWLAAERRLLVPGSWQPLGLILAIFSLRYVTAVSLALQPQWVTQLNVQLPLALAFGGLSGFFMGRALGLYQTSQTSQTSPAGQQARA